MKSNKPFDLNHESTGRLNRLPESKELLKIINELEEYLKKHETICTGTIKIQKRENKKDLIGLYGNEYCLIAVALRLLHIATYPKGAHFHLDGYSGELDDGTDEMFIMKTDDEGNYKNTEIDKINQEMLEQFRKLKKPSK